MESFAYITVDYNSYVCVCERVCYVPTSDMALGVTNRQFFRLHRRKMNWMAWHGAVIVWMPCNCHTVTVDWNSIWAVYLYLHTINTMHTAVRQYSTYVLWASHNAVRFFLVWHVLLPIWLPGMQEPEVNVKFIVKKENKNSLLVCSLFFSQYAFLAFDFFIIELCYHGAVDRIRFSMISFQLHCCSCFSPLILFLTPRAAHSNWFSWNFLSK